MKTELVFILDRSGSMRGLEKDTIGGFNSMIERQKKEEGTAVVSTVLFDDVSEVIHDRVPLEKMEPLTEKQYFVRGSTALLDAIGDAVRFIGNVHKYARPEDRPDRTIFVITTDGYENASRKYTYAKIKEMIERQQTKYGWEFLFLGANIDAVAEAGRFGIAADRAVRYENDSQGTALNYEVVGDTVASMRAAPMGARRMGAEWKQRIEQDYQTRGTGAGSTPAGPDPVPAPGPDPAPDPGTPDAGTQEKPRKRGGLFGFFKRD